MVLKKSEAYCLRCKKGVKPTGKKVVKVKTRSGQRAQMKGKCPKCKTEVRKFVKME